MEGVATELELDSVDTKAKGIVMKNINYQNEMNFYNHTKLLCIVCIRYLS